MKTKLIILGAIAVTLLHSCSTDREEEATNVNEAIKKNSNPEQFKFNRGSDAENIEGSEIIVVKDTINVLFGDPVPPANPEDGGDPKDVPVPPRR